MTVEENNGKRCGLDARSLGVLSLVFALLVGSASMSLAEPTVDGSSKAKVIGSRVNVRAKANTESNVLFQVNRGEMLDVVEKQGTWYLIEHEKLRGYIFGPLIEIVEIAPPAEPMVRTSPVKMSPPVSSTRVPAPVGETMAMKEEKEEEPAESMAEAQRRDGLQKKEKHGLYKMIGGGAGVVTGLAMMGKSKAAGFGLVGAGGYFLWDGYSDRQEAGRRLRWGIALHVNRDTKGVAYHMSW